MPKHLDRTIGAIDKRIDAVYTRPIMALTIFDDPTGPNGTVFSWQEPSNQNARVDLGWESRSQPAIATLVLPEDGNRYVIVTNGGEFRVDTWCNWEVAFVSFPPSS